MSEETPNPIERYHLVLDDLTDKQRAFVEVYRGDGAEAARLAGYSSSGAAQAASRLLRHRDVKRALELRGEAEAFADRMRVNLEASVEQLDEGQPLDVQPDDLDHDVDRGGATLEEAQPEQPSAPDASVNGDVNLNNRDVKGVKGAARRGQRPEVVDAPPPAGRDSLVRRTKLSRRETEGFLTGVILGEVTTTKSTLFGQQYEAPATMRERIDATKVYAKMQGWMIDTQASLEGLRELNAYKDQAAREARLEELQAERARVRAEIAARRAGADIEDAVLSPVDEEE